MHLNEYRQAATGDVRSEWEVRGAKEPASRRYIGSNSRVCRHLCYRTYTSFSQTLSPTRAPPELSGKLLANRARLGRTAGTAAPRSRRIAGKPMREVFNPHPQIWNSPARGCLWPASETAHRELQVKTCVPALIGRSLASRDCRLVLAAPQVPCGTQQGTPTASDMHFEASSGMLFWRGWVAVSRLSAALAKARGVQIGRTDRRHWAVAEFFAHRQTSHRQAEKCP